ARLVWFESGPSRPSRALGLGSASIWQRAAAAVAAAEGLSGGPRHGPPLGSAYALQGYRPLAFGLPPWLAPLSIARARRAYARELSPRGAGSVVLVLDPGSYVRDVAVDAARSHAALV